MMRAISGNTQHAGHTNRGYAESWTSEQLDRLLSEAWLKQMVTDIRAGDVKQKDQLPYICPHYSAFKNNHRAQKDIIPEAFTFMTCVDVDDLSKVDKAISRALELNGEDGGDWQDQVLRIEYSARRKVHIYIRIPVGKTIEEAQNDFCAELGDDIVPDESCCTPERFIYVTGRDEEVFRSPHWLEDIPPTELEERREAYLMRGLDVDGRKLVKPAANAEARKEAKPEAQAEAKPAEAAKATNATNTACPADARTLFIFDQCMREAGLEPQHLIVEGARHDSLKSILSVGAAQLLRKEELMSVLQVRMPQNWQDKNIRTLVDDFYGKYTDTSQKMTQFQRRVFSASLKGANGAAAALCSGTDGADDGTDTDQQLQAGDISLSYRKMPQGVRDSIEAVGVQLAMPAVTAICPCIGALATGVQLDVHGKKKGLNLIAYIAGDFASGKGQIDPVVEAWMSEVAALDKMYQMQEEEWRRKKRAAKNKKEQPEEPKLPVRCIALNNTVANIAERLANTEGKHAFSYTPEADTVALKWKQSISDFSVMVRQSYDGSRYDREARSADAVNVHIDHLLWNVVMCGTPDALHRVVHNYTDGFQSRIAVARTPDNTYEPLADKPPVLTDRQTERIRQIAHLLPLMQGDVVLPKLEGKGREWLEKVRLETMKNDDRVKARQRIRICVTAQRMTCCLMLCKVCETLIQKHGLNGAEALLKQQPTLWKEQLVKTQTPTMLDAYEVIADGLMDNALHFFRDRIENAFASRDYTGMPNSERTRRGKNDSIYERLDVQFTFEQAMQHSVAVKGAGVTHNSVQQMLKNWKKQGLVEQGEEGKYRKLSH